MATELVELELDEISLVDKGANQEAKAPIFKAQTPKENDMDENYKMSEEMDKKIKDYMKEKGCDRKTAEAALMKAFDEHETYKAENERLRKSLLDAGYVIKKDEIVKKDIGEHVIYKGETITKADDPARFELAQEVLKYETEKRDAEFAKRATEELPNHKPEVAVALLKSIDGADNKDELMASLKAADKSFGELMVEKGEAAKDADLSDPADKLEKMAKAYAQENKVTYFKAYDAVIKTDEGKDLLKQSKVKE